MPEEGTLSIVRRGTCYQVRYASNNVHARERLPRVCPDEARLAALLHDSGTESAVIAQVCADVRHGKMAVLLVVGSAEQLHACFPPAPQARVVSLPNADKYRGLTRRPSQEQKGLDERTLMASQQPFHPW